MGYGDNWKPLKHSAICSRHFKPSDFRLNTNIPRLLPNAIPTIKVDDKFNSKLLINGQPIVSESEIEISHEELVTNDDYSIEDLDKICGLCGKEYRFTLKNVLKNYESNEWRLFEYLNFSLNMNNHLPISVCPHCENKLNEFELFILQIKETQEKLLKRFHECEINENIVEGDSLVEKRIYDDYEPPHPKQQISSKENNTPDCQPPNIPDNSTVHTYVIPLPEYYSPNTEFCPNIKMCIEPAPKQPYQNPETPIKMETTPCINNSNPKPSKESNRKIKILQDIKIDPQQILVNPLRNELLLNGKTDMTNAEKIMLPNKTTNINMDLKTMSLLSNSMAICQYCHERFVSRYALNHHIKFLCKSAVSSMKSPFASCANCKKTFTCEVKLKSHIVKCFSPKPLKKRGKHRRKPSIVMKRHIINNCSYLVGYDLKSKTLLNV